MATSDRYLLEEQVTFIQHHLPGLEAGAYQLQVTQQLNDQADQPISDSSLTNTYTFAVRGERFRLSNPADVIFGLYPADSATGEYGNVFPHVVFSKRTFPWLRQPGTQAPPATPAPGTDTDQDVPTWLAVLLLDEDDAARYPGLNLTPQPATIRDLYPATLRAGSTLAANQVSYFRHAAASSELELGDQLTDAIQVLDLPLALFWEVAPAPDDLPYLAHARQVSLRPKATLTGISDVGEPLGDFALVVGNRLPQAQRKAYAYLVSLEEMQELLPSPDGTPPAAGAPLAGGIRLAVLKHWTFFSTDADASFATRLLALNGRAADSPTEAAQVHLCLPYAGSYAVVQRALQLGYAPLNHQLRTGEATVSWYRGPLVPQPVAGQRLQVPVASPDQATRFDPTTGMFDASYAAAWTLGRLLALQDKAFSTALYSWKRGLSTQLVQRLESALLQQRLAAAQATTGAEASPPTNQPAAVVPLRQHLVQALIQAHSR